ncbi:MAG: nuclease-related domain-containing protein [bacterium]|nr:nuclease-related domain-containing protein [bacterium]
MPLSNSYNPKKGRDFEEKVSQALEKKYKTSFKKRSINIGTPPKAHNFDLVSENGTIIVECKNYSWTETGNIPSAKTAFLNEAVLYLSHASADSKKIIVLRKDNHPKRKESLAEYYVRTYFHLLNAVVIMELDINNMIIKEVGRNIA